jgi:hypothetical protein
MKEADPVSEALYLQKEKIWTASNVGFTFIATDDRHEYLGNLPAQSNQ